jgi:hypothetical protein
VESLDVIKHVSFGFIQGRVSAMVYALALEHPEKAFAGRVVATMTDGTHAADQVVPAQISLVISTDELATTIRMQNPGVFSWRWQRAISTARITMWRSCR